MRLAVLRSGRAVRALEGCRDGASGEFGRWGEEWVCVVVFGNRVESGYHRWESVFWTVVAPLSWPRVRVRGVVQLLT